MSLHRANNMTDDQWVALIGVVNTDDDKWRVIYPSESGASVRGIDPNGNPFIIKTDGEIKR